MPKVAVFVDGFNVYFGLKSLIRRGRASYKWLDYWSLGDNLMTASPAAQKGDELVSVKYFTAIVQNDQQKAAKHVRYISALRNQGVEVILGRYFTHNESCRKPGCGASWIRGEEKQSDVALGLHMLSDAYEDAYDKAILVTGDSDQVPSISMVRSKFPEKKIVLAYPPDRTRSNDLDMVLEPGFTMKFNGLLSGNQLPDPTTGPFGEIACPDDWK